MRVGLPVPAVTIDDRTVDVEVLVISGGAWSVEFATVVEDLGLQLQSTYLGGRQRTAVSHLLLAPGAADELSQRVSDELSAVSDRGACLLDHLHELADAITTVTGSVPAIELPDRALELAQQT